MIRTTVDRSKIHHQFRRGLGLISFLIIYGIASLKMAHAQPVNPTVGYGITFGDIICKISTELYGTGGKFGLGNIFTGIAYIAGAFFIGNGIYKFKDTVDSPGRNPWHVPISRCIGGVCLMSLPAMIGWAMTTLGYNVAVPGSSAMAACAAGTVSTTATTDPSQMFNNLMTNIKTPMRFLISVAGYLIGTFMVIRGFMKMARYGTDPKATLTSILANVIVGAMMFSVGTNAAIFVATIFGTGQVQSSSVVSNWQIWTKLGGNTAQLQAATVSVINFFQIIGAIAFLRGWIIVKNAAEGHGSDTMTKGFVHVIGGCLCLNLFVTLEAFDKAFGSNWLGGP